MNKVLVIFIFACLAGAAGAVDGGTAPRVTSVDFPERLLFVGNSFTYYNDGLSKHYGNLLRAADLRRAGRSRVRMLTLSGSGLHEHEAALASVLDNERFDAVIMHGYSNGPITRRAAAFRAASVRLAELVRANDADPILLMTWAYKGRAGMMAELREAYTAQGNQLGALVIPVGPAFAAAEANLDIELYSPDIDHYDGSTPVYRDVVKHPSLAGTYLAACVVFAAVTGRTPEGLVYDAGLPPSLARSLQTVAAETVQAYYAR